MFIRRIINFFTNHNRLEFLTLVLALLFVLITSVVSLFLWQRTESVKSLIGVGKEYLETEEYDKALASFKTARTLSQIDLGIVKITLSKNPQNQIEMTSKLEASHEHFIAGLAYLNRKHYLEALKEFDLVDPLDPNSEFAKSKKLEIHNRQKEEQKLLASFNEAYNQSVASCGAKDYGSCLKAADGALSLVNEDYHFDKTRIAELHLQKKEARVAQRLAEEAKKNTFNLKVPILMYHYIRVNPDPNDKVGVSLSVTPEDFDKQMQYLASNGYNTVDVNTVANAVRNKTTLPAKSIVLTFDDGYRDFYTTAFPLLKKYNLHAEAYVVPGFLGAGNYMTWDMVKEVVSSGLVTIGSHTLHHTYLSSSSATNLRTELNTSKKELENNLGIKITDFCYPYGAFNSMVAAEVEKAGYTNATTTVFGKNHYQGGYFTMPRVRIGGGQSLDSFIKRL